LSNTKNYGLKDSEPKKGRAQRDYNLEKKGSMSHFFNGPLPSAYD